MIREFQRLKTAENEKNALEWNLTRSLSKINYRIHTDAIAQTLIPKEVVSAQVGLIYASEADVLNIALFGTTAKAWKTGNPQKEGNMRDHAAVEQLVVLSNLESMNAELIRQGLSQAERLEILNRVAITQIQSILGSPSLKRLK